MNGKNMSSKGTINRESVMKDANKLKKWGETKMTLYQLYLACNFLVLYFEEEQGMKLSKADKEKLHSRGDL
ncbi:hypothetical protein MCGE09_00456 [Thaumarchaeota archaeon SCGC AB-539-E09]|nr:hypothetical protein MCGE09_00456 [Thaumarchaeota archaeon SCGC AB-539-E09]